MKHWLTGNLTLEAFMHDPIQNGAVIGMVLGGIAIFAALTYFKLWKYVWHEWLCSLDPKRIGVMYATVAIVMLIKGLADAILMRWQQALAVGDAMGPLTSDHFQQIFSAHGTTMIFFVGMGSIFALMNLVIPLQIGARDVAFPYMNAVSFWFFAGGALMVLVSMAIGNFTIAGWLSYPPLSGLEYSPGEGVDYWIWTLQIAGIGSLLAGINFFVTILKMRCPGMTMMKMPIFVWSILSCLVLILFAFPILTSTLALLTLDRYADMHFFTSSFGGNQMMYVNLIWAWGHPEVYILVLPAFGVYSEVVATFSEKRLFGYASMVGALIAITFLSFIVWLHHFFTMGAGANVNAFFGIMTMLIAVPTGVKVFNWLFTMFQGRVHFTTPMLWFTGFITTFTIGGMAGVLMSIPPVDFQVHNSLFLVAHFHSVIIGGVLFGFFAAITYWFPKVFGFKLNERLGKWAFWFWLTGFLTAFLPLYALGLMGATRRLDHYSESTGWHPLFLLASMGAALITIGVGFQLLQIYVSIRDRDQNRDTTGDPWNGRTLEWSIQSPPEEYNFAVLPEVDQRDPFWAMKQSKTKIKPVYEDIHMPKPSAIPVVLGAFAFTMCFAITWQIYWLTIVCFIGAVASMIVRLTQENTEHTITASEVATLEAKRK